MKIWSYNQRYIDGRPVCPICNKRINEDQLYIIENNDPTKHYYCARPTGTRS